ncbi:hypothetical protein ABPG74_015259 [Tetrahymena malaccensis]
MNEKQIELKIINQIEKLYAQLLLLYEKTQLIHEQIIKIIIIFVDLNGYLLFFILSFMIFHQSKKAFRQKEKQLGRYVGKQVCQGRKERERQMF